MGTRFVPVTADECPILYANGMLYRRSRGNRWELRPAGIMLYEGETFAHFIDLGWEYAVLVED